jgi:rod shape-determining protein MreC
MPFSLRERKNVVVLAVLVFLNLLLISIQVPLGSKHTLFNKIIFSVFSPVQRAVVSAGAAVSETWNGFFRLRGVRVENQKLQKDIFFLRQENMLLLDRLKFLQGDKMIQDNQAAIRKTVLSARVIGVDASNYYKSIVINRGGADGVKANMAVCDKHGNLVGRVIEPVALKEAKVQLITDEDSGVSVISGTDKVVGLLSGDSRGSCRIRYVVTTTPGGQEGEDLFTTGYDKLFPPGIRVGKITVIKTDGSFFKTILVQPFFSYGDLDQVAVLKERFEDLF